MTVAIITDGAASLPDDRARIDNVTVVPLRVAIGMAIKEDPPPTLAEVLSAHPSTVHTSCPAPNRYLAAITRCHSGAGVVICTVASSLSGSYQAAVQAARRAQVPVRVIDTGTAAGGQGLVVLAAGRVAQTGAALDVVADSAVRCSAQVRLVGSVATFDRLVASGRVSHLTGWAASRLGVHPVFELRDGRIRELRPAHSQRAAEMRMIECFRASGRPDSVLHVSVLHVLAPDRARRILELVAGEQAPVTAYISEFDAAMATHLGPGVVGLAWWRELSARLQGGDGTILGIAKVVDMDRWQPTQDVARAQVPWLNMAMVIVSTPVYSNPRNAVVDVNYLSCLDNEASWKNQDTRRDLRRPVARASNRRLRP